MARDHHTSTGEPTAPARRIAGLDGLRGIAVILVVVYHLWPRVLPGGFLGVTVFFALSGFLIVGLLVDERENTGTIRLGAFAARRVRRLLPPALLVLVLVAVGWTVWGRMTPELARDLRFSVAQLANWGQLTSGTPYGVVELPSPVVHFWSLAIEEQAYVIVPAVVLLARRRWILGAVLAAGVALSLVLTLRAAGDALVTYYSTFTRIGEILVGGLVALAVRCWRPGPTTRLATVPIAVGCVTLVLLAARTWHIDDRVVTSGGLLAVGGVAAVMVGAISLAPQLGRVLDVRPLAALGRVSYAVYLIHWPVLIGLTTAGAPAAIAPWATLAATAVLAAASARWIERPLRDRTSTAARARIRTRTLVAAVPVAALVAFVVSAAGSSRTDRTDFEALAAEFDAASASAIGSMVDPARPPATAQPSATAPSATVPSATVPSATVPSTTVPDLPPGLTFGYVGDSKALALATGVIREPLEGWTLGPGFVELGCPLGRGGERRDRAGGHVHPVGPECDWTDLAERHAEDERVLDVAVVWFGSWDVHDRRVPELGADWHRIHDPDYRAWLLDELDQLTELVVDALGAEVVLVLTLPFDPAVHRRDDVAAWNAMLREFASSTGRSVEVVDIVAWAEASGEYERLLPDDAHPSFGPPGEPNSARELHEGLLLPRARVLLGNAR